MPRAEPDLALVRDLPGALGLGFVEDDLQPALDLARTLAVPITPVLAGHKPREN